MRARILQKCPTKTMSNNMKREHKYRGKRLDGQGWAVGSYIEAELQNGIAHEIIPYKRGEPVVEVDPDTIGQFTGLKDKNGRDIYEGDIIECVDSHGEPVRHFVEFCGRRGYYAQYFAGHSPLPAYEAGPIYQDYIDEFGKYVIGNIHDNPELLKTE